MIQPITVSVGAGSDAVQASSLDTQLRQIVSAVNELVALANQIDPQFPDKCLRPYHMSAELRGYLQAVCSQVKSIRKQFGTGAILYPLEGHGVGSYPLVGKLQIWSYPYPDANTPAVVPFVVGGDSSIVYRLKFRLRSICQHTLYTLAKTQIRGTVTVTAGSNVVNGAATVFTDDCSQVLNPDPYRGGQGMWINGQYFPLASIESDTVMHTVSPIPFNFTGPAYASVCAWDIGYPTMTRFEQVALSAPPAGAKVYAPFIIGCAPGTMVPFGGRDYLTLDVSNPPQEIALSFQRFTTVAHRDYDAFPDPRDQTFDILVNGGSTINLRSQNSDTAAAFLPETGFPNDDDPRFPLVARFRVGQMVQLDLLAIDPVKPDQEGNFLETQAGVPIDTNHPQAHLEVA